MSPRPRISTEAKDAAQILRGYKDRIERLEEDSSGSGEAVQLYRKALETVTCSDETIISVEGGASFEWNTSQWGFSEWEDN